MSDETVYPKSRFIVIVIIIQLILIMSVIPSVIYFQSISDDKAAGYWIIDAPESDNWISASNDRSIQVGPDFEITKYNIVRPVIRPNVKWKISISSLPSIQEVGINMTNPLFENQHLSLNTIYSYHFRDYNGNELELPKTNVPFMNLKSGNSFYWTGESTSDGYCSDCISFFSLTIFNLIESTGSLTVLISVDFEDHGNWGWMIIGYSVSLMFIVYAITRKIRKREYLQKYNIHIQPEMSDDLISIIVTISIFIPLMVLYITKVILIT